MTVMKMVQCAGCDLPILDRFIFSVLERSWHDKCVQCSDCKCNLTEKCFSRDGKLYCRNDFFKRFGTKCAGCCQGILPTDLVRRARNKVFHIKCFTCLVCRKQLSTGEQLYVLEENRFVCVKDYNSGRHNGASGPLSLPVQASAQHHHHHHHQALINDSSTSNGDGVTGIEEADLEDSLQSPGEGINGELGREDLDSDGEETGSLLGLEPLNTMTSLGHHHGHPIGSHHGNHHHHHLSAKSSPMSATSSMSDSGIGCSGASSGGQGINGGSGSMMDPNSPSSHHMNGPGGMNGTNGGSTNDENAPGTKRRGPRTTIKAKQLETLKAAFAATPKPTRHIREQLANETGLNMRVIQVWFQNRRSKERRMKQLNSLGARRHFFRNSRRAMRPLRPGMSPDGVSVLEDSPDSMAGPPTSGPNGPPVGPGGPPPPPGSFGYFSETSNPSDFQYSGVPPPPQPPGGYFDFYPPGQGPPMMGEGGMVPPYGGPGGHGPPPPPASVPNMHGDLHQPGILNLGSDAPYLGADRGSVSPSSSLDGGISMPSMTPDTFGRPNSASSGPPGASNGFQPMETSVW